MIDKRSLNGYKSNTNNSDGVQDNLKVIERKFQRNGQHFVNAGLALISILVMYWTINPTFDIIIKRSLYLMMIFVMCAIIFPFNKKSSLAISKIIFTVSLVAALANVEINLLTIKS